jgi:hypothetical protein
MNFPDETLSTVQYGNRAKNIQNKPAIDEDPKDTMLREYQEEIKILGTSSPGGSTGKHNESLLKYYSQGPG